jgi:hypothetical protein
MATRPEKRRRVRSDLLIIECNSEGLARDAMNLGTLFGKIMSVGLQGKRIALVQTSAIAKVKDQLDAAFASFGTFRSILIVGHSDATALDLAKDGSAAWGDVGRLLKRFRPKHLFLAACEAGRSEAVREIFESVDALEEIYASPVPLLKIHTAPMAVLIWMLLTKGKLTAEESAGLRIASFITWGVQTYCWRWDEFGPGKELELQSWDALATWLGTTSWDLSDAIAAAIRKLVTR